MTKSKIPYDLYNDLIKEGIETNIDPASIVAYSTDASIDQIYPLGITFPRSSDEISAIVEISLKYRTPVIARGAATMAQTYEPFGDVMVDQVVVYLGN